MTADPGTSRTGGGATPHEAAAAPDTVHLGLDATVSLCERAARAAGAGEETARSLAASVVAAEAEGVAAVGLTHFVDYLEALQAGRIDGQVEPAVTRPAPCLFLADARGGIMHTAFDRTIDDLARSARLFGIALLAQRNAFTAGGLGYFTGRLAAMGLVALAASNGPPLLAVPGSAGPVYCTNPLSFAAPVADGPPLVIDQSSSGTAFVSVRRAAEEGRVLPEGWAIDRDGKPTTDPAAALRGALLAFGGTRGANIALMVEVLSAGVTGANWSLDSPSFSEGPDSPGAGMMVIALQPVFFAPDFGLRLKAQLDRLADEHGVYIPGRARAARAAAARMEGLTLQRALLERIEVRCCRRPAGQRLTCGPRPAAARHGQPHFSSNLCDLTVNGAPDGLLRCNIRGDSRGRRDPTFPSPTDPAGPGQFLCRTPRQRRNAAQGGRRGGPRQPRLGKIATPSAPRAWSRASASIPARSGRRSCRSPNSLPASSSPSAS